MPYKRLFIAIKIIPPKSFINILLNFKSAVNHENISWININQLHLTLHFFGEIDEDLIPDISKLLLSIVSETNNFNLLCSKIGIFGSRHSPKVIWLGVEENPDLLILKSKICNVLQAYGFKVEPLKFVPHITLARIKKIEDLNFFNLCLDKFKIFVEFSHVVNDFHLFESVLTPKGAIHKVLDSYNLK